MRTWRLAIQGCGKRRIWDEIAFGITFYDVEEIVVITDEQFAEFLALDHELPGVEFKGPGPRSDDYLRAKVARAIMGMTNRRDGGIIIIGVEERNGRINPMGLPQNELDSWRNYDHVTTAFASYMNPPASFDLNICQFDGKDFVVLEVHEFADIPTICKKRYQHNHQSGHPEIVLREGACYIRSRHKAETVEISSPDQMRELLELATEKGVRKFVTQAQRAGLSLSGSSQPSDQELFEQQIQDWNSPLKERIQSRGYWRVLIRPDTFSQDSLQYNGLFSLVQGLSVDLHGDSFPNALPGHPLNRGVDCIGQEIEAGHFLEAWNIYQSGQFIYYFGMVDDWIDQSGWFRITENWQPGTRFAIEEVIRQYTGIFVFASRLALTDAYTQDDYIHINVLIKGLQGRKLYISSPGKVPLRWNYEAHIPEFPDPRRILKAELIANPAGLALQASKELFDRFGWNASLATLESTQATYYKSS